MGPRTLSGVKNSNFVCFVVTLAGGSLPDGFGDGWVVG